MWEEIVEKTVDIEAKASLQPLSRKREIDFKCPKSYRSIKKDKDEANLEYRDRDKTKSYNPFPANTSQLQT